MIIELCAMDEGTKVPNYLKSQNYVYLFHKNFDEDPKSANIIKMQNVDNGHRFTFMDFAYTYSRI